MKKYFTKQIDGILSLCTTITEVGDTVLFQLIPNTTPWKEAKVVYVFEDDELTVRVGDWQTITTPDKFCFKIIGEVSKSATWIKEWMEFDNPGGMYKGEWQALPFYDRDEQVTLLGSARQLRKIVKGIKPVKYIVQFKCPTCGIFH